VSQWKTLETLVARTFGGVRGWATEHDALIVADATFPGIEPAVEKALAAKDGGAQLMALGSAGLVELASIEVKNLRTVTVPMLERFLAKNRQKASRDGVRYSGLAIKRKAGRGVQTPVLLVLNLEDFDDES
jgi:hypothetical protein